MHVENEIAMPIINVKIPHVAYLKLIMSKIRKDQINKTSATILDRHPIVTAKCTRSLSVFSQQGGPPGHSQVGKGRALRGSQSQRGEFDFWMEQLGDVILNYGWSSLVM
ncbi:Uncharacterized protein Fot_50548 [Forsythia ovata]|uniref:Uncharacterized protein n=1 Tax=Forsythia ovata TaxID=205694 RepID=A0ABD1PYG6_9LAMI